MTADGELLTIGQRIKWWRERRGLSQRVLGDLIDRSENWVYKIENDRVALERLPVLIALSNVLRCSLDDLTGGYVSRVSTTGTKHESVPSIRQALTLPTSLLPLRVGSVSAEDFEFSVTDAWRVYETQVEDTYRDVGSRLPGLLRQGHAALRDTSNARQESAVLRQLISLYGLHQMWLRRVGEPGLARIAVDRGLALADNAGDPALLAAAAWNLACVLTSAGDVEDSYELARQVLQGQRDDYAGHELYDLGITDVRTGQVRPFGRGAQGAPPYLGRLCGQCGRGEIAILPDGLVTPCVFARWMSMGNVHQRSLREIYGGETMRNTRGVLEEAFPHTKPAAAECLPDMCTPNCNPSFETCAPQLACAPDAECAPTGHSDDSNNTDQDEVARPWHLSPKRSVRYHDPGVSRTDC